MSDNFELVTISTLGDDNVVFVRKARDLGDLGVNEQHTNAAFVFPYFRFDDGSVCAALQCNPKHGYHLIGGKSDVGEDAMSTVERELREEVGEYCKNLIMRNPLTTTVHDFFSRGKAAHAVVYQCALPIEDLNKLVAVSSDHEHPLRLVRLKSVTSLVAHASKICNLAVIRLFNDATTSI